METPLGRVPLITTTPSAPVKRQQSRKQSRNDANSYSRANHQLVAKRTLKYLSICRTPSVFRLVVREAPDTVIKTICNAALNAERGDVSLTNAQKALFRKHRAQIALLTSLRPSLASKRRLLTRKTQTGGATFIPTLINAVLASLGGSLFSKD